MRLNDIQAQFKDLIFSRPEALDNLPGDFAACFLSRDHSLTERLKIYRNNVMGTVGNALAANFPLLEKLVGREFLMAMVRAYILSHPPETGCLTFYGENFPRFMESYAPAKNLAYLADVARLEIALNAAYNAQDDFPLTKEDLSEIAPNDLDMFHLKLRHSVHLLCSPWPLPDIRDFCLSEDHDQELDIRSEGVYLMVHRPQLDPVISTLSAGEYEFLNLVQTKALGEATAAALDLFPDFDLASLLQRHLSLETFQRI